MNFIDFLIIVLVGAAAVRGVASGFLRQLGSIGGFVVGMLAGAILAPFIAGILPPTPGRPFLILMLFFAIALTVSGIGEAVGEHFRGLTERAGLGQADGVLGAAFGFIGTLLAVWLLAATFGQAGGPQLATDVAGSRILAALDQVLPPAPEVTARIERLVGAGRFPQVFAGLEPTPAPPVTGPNAAAVNAAAAAARESTVKVEGAGCGGIVEGSGFVVGSGLVATNAHVVAGIDRPQITDSAGRHTATVVWFDPDLDLAVLRTTRLAGAPLPLDTRNEPRGTVAAVLGYPGGGSFTPGAAAILARLTAVGRDIYDTGLIHRDIYVLQAVVRPGNSGGPLVTEGGAVIGVVFATSTTNPDVGYALTSPEIMSAITQAKSHSAVGTGPCIAD